MNAQVLAYDRTGVRAGGGRTAVTHGLHRAGTPRHSGGLVVCVVATATALALIAVVVAGRAAVDFVSTAAGSGLSGASTCRDYLASADPTAKAAVMKDLYLARHKPELAADPFIVRNTGYYCGHHPDAKLTDVAGQG